MGNSFVREQNMIIIRDLSCIFYVNFSFLETVYFKIKQAKKVSDFCDFSESQNLGIHHDWVI